MNKVGDQFLCASRARQLSKRCVHSESKSSSSETFFDFFALEGGFPPFFDAGLEELPLEAGARCYCKDHKLGSQTTSRHVSTYLALFGSRFLLLFILVATNVSELLSEVLARLLTLSFLLACLLLRDGLLGLFCRCLLSLGLGLLLFLIILVFVLLRKSMPLVPAR